jgi:hypothetical protein
LYDIPGRVAPGETGAILRMKTYAGVRTIDGLRVTVDGEPLDEAYGAKQFTKWGFEWTYVGAEPLQLALAILVDHLGDEAKAIKNCDKFMRDVVANMDNDWTLTSDEIDKALNGWKDADSGRYGGSSHDK